MASNQPGHFIQRLTIEADIDAKPKANDIQNELSRIFNNHLISIAERIMDEEDVPDHLLRIRGLEIDLGDMSEAYLQGDVITAFTIKFRSALQEMKAKAGYQNPYFDRDAELIALFPAKSEFLTYFLKYGRFPSGAYGFTEKPENVLLEMIQENSERSKKYISGLVKKEPKAAARIVSQFSNTTLRSVFRLFSPSYADFIQREIRQIEPELRRVTKLKQDITIVYLKEASFEFLLQNQRILFTRQHFLTSLKEKLEKKTQQSLVEIFPESKPEEEEVLDEETKEYLEKGIERLRKILRNPKALARQENLPQLWEQLVGREPQKVMELLKEVVKAPGRLLQLVEELTSELLFSLVVKTVPASSRSLIRVVSRVIAAHASYLRGRQAETFFRNIVHSNLLRFLLEEPSSADKPKEFVDFLEVKLKSIPQVPEKLKEQWESFQFAEVPVTKAEKEREEQEKEQKRKEEEAKAAKAKAEKKAEEEAQSKTKTEAEAEEQLKKEEETRAIEEKAIEEKAKEDQVREEEKKVEEAISEIEEEKRAKAEEIEEAAEEKTEKQIEEEAREKELKRQKEEETGEEKTSEIQIQEELAEKAKEEEALEKEELAKEREKKANEDEAVEEETTAEKKRLEEEQIAKSKDPEAQEEEQVEKSDSEIAENEEAETLDDPNKGLLPNNIEEELGEEADPEQAQVDFIIHFLREGELPWWSKNLIQPDPRLVIQNLVGSKSALFLEAFKKLLNNLTPAERPEVASRFLSRFGEDEMTEVLKGLVPSIYGFMATMALALDEFQNKGNAIPEKTYLFKGLSFRWHYVVRFYMDYGSNLPGPNEFVNYVVEMIAAGLSVPLEEVSLKLREIAQEQVDKKKMRFAPLLSMLPMQGAKPSLNSPQAEESLLFERGGEEEVEAKVEAPVVSEESKEGEEKQTEEEAETLSEEEVAAREESRKALQAEMERVKEELRKQRGEKPKPSGKEEEVVEDDASDSKGEERVEEALEEMRETEEELVEVDKPISNAEESEEPNSEVDEVFEAQEPDAGKPESRQPGDKESPQLEEALQGEVEEEPVDGPELLEELPSAEETPLEQPSADPKEAEVVEEEAPVVEKQDAEESPKPEESKPVAEEEVDILSEETAETEPLEKPKEEPKPESRERPDLDELFTAFEDEAEDEAPKTTESEAALPSREEKTVTDPISPGEEEEKLAEGQKLEEPGEAPVLETESESDSETSELLPGAEQIEAAEEAKSEEESEPLDSPLEAILYFLEKGSLPQGAFARFSEEQTLDLLESALEEDEVRVRTEVASLLKRPAIQYKYARLPERLLLRVLSLNLPAGSERLFISYFRNLRTLFESFPGTTAHFIAAEHIFSYFSASGPPDLQVDTYLRDFLSYMAAELGKPQIDLIEFIHDQIAASPSRVSVTLQEVIAAIRTEMVRPGKKIQPEEPGEEETKTVEIDESQEPEIVIPEAEDSEDTYIYINNAGLSLALAVLPATFKALGYLTPKGKFVNEQLRMRAVHFLAYLSHLRVNPPEEELIFNKLIVGMDIDQTLPKELALTDDEKETAEELITMIMEKWKGLHKVSSNSFRSSWLQRQGRLRKEDGNKWTVRVDQTAIDRLMVGIPWPTNRWSSRFSQWEFLIEW